MSDQYALTPRVFLVRHGETEWAKSGRFTSFTEIKLTETGAAQVSSTAAKLVGAGKLVDPGRLVHIFVSPRARARMTLDLLLPSSDNITEVTATEDITEWNYGRYEGLKDQEIRLLRKTNGLDSTSEWNIWSDGCEGGESMQQVTARLDRLICQIKAIQAPCMRGEKPADIIIVAHGLILRCFMKRWTGFPIDFNIPFIMDTGAITVLRKIMLTSRPCMSGWRFHWSEVDVRRLCLLYGEVWKEKRINKLNDINERVTKH